jgi:hypothetical protein
MWKRDGTHVTLSSADLSASLDVAQPCRGIQELVVRVNGDSISLAESHIFQVTFSPRALVESISDCWVRGDDVVAVYAPSSQRPFSPEIYWRHLSSLPAAATGVELIISVQTKLLDATPESSVSSTVPGAEVWWLPAPDSESASHTPQLCPATFAVLHGSGPGAFLFRYQSIPLSYLEMIHPSDFCGATLDGSDRRGGLQWRLFHESLEKGVIRRARLRGLFVPRDSDLSDAGRHYRDFVASPIPLTT